MQFRGGWPQFDTGSVCIAENQPNSAPTCIQGVPLSPLLGWRGTSWVVKGWGLRCCHGRSRDRVWSSRNVQGLWENLQELHTQIPVKPPRLAIPRSLFVYLGSLPAYLLFWDRFSPKLEITLSKVAEEEAGYEVLYCQLWMSFKNHLEWASPVEGAHLPVLIPAGLWGSGAEVVSSQDQTTTSSHRSVAVVEGVGFGYNL